MIYLPEFLLFEDAYTIEIHLTQTMGRYNFICLYNLAQKLLETFFLSLKPLTPIFNPACCRWQASTYLTYLFKVHYIATIATLLPFDELGSGM